MSGLFADNVCSGTGFVGGVEIGENGQFRRVILGVAAELDYWSPEDPRHGFTSNGTSVPQGSYSYSGRTSPADLLIAGARIGYAGDIVLPYLTLGAVATASSRARVLDFVPVGSAKTAATFSEGVAFPSTGWALGTGAQIGLNGAWSITAEVQRIQFGKTTSTRSGCSGPVSICGGLSDISLETIHDAIATVMYRIGITYWFNYWEP